MLRITMIVIRIILTRVTAISPLFGPRPTNNRQLATRVILEGRYFKCQTLAAIEELPFAKAKYAGKGNVVQPF